MKLEIETLSYTLIGSGESSGIIDNDIVFDDYGIPYIPARRVKGLLRESSREVCELLDLDKKIIHKIFGKTGIQEAKIKINNLYIENYKNIINEMQIFQEKDIYKKFLTKNKILSYFTKIRQLTAIDEKGIAKEKSLRTIRLLKPKIIFSTELKLHNLTDYDIAFLFLSCKNLRRIGGMRNRGLGKIQCSLKCKLTLDEALKIIEKNHLNNTPLQPIHNNRKEEENINLKNIKKILPFKIKTLSPIIIGIQKGAQNTIKTKLYIPALSIRGLLANKYIQKMGLKTENAHNDPLFFNLFLSNNVYINNAYPFTYDKVFLPVPLCIHKQEGYDTKDLYNILLKPLEINTKPINGFVLIDNDKIILYNPETIIYFHHKRDRLVGSSIKEDIFYYEAIKENQEFKGYLYGDENLLKEIKNIFKEKFQGEIGKSRTAQYGKIEFVFEDLKDIEGNEYLNNKEITITAISPIILYNECGFTLISNNILKQYLEDYLGCKIKKITSIMKLEQIENYVNVWHSKTPREWAFGTGSTFLIEFESPIDENIKNHLLKLEIEGIGEKVEIGFGKVKINWTVKEKYNKEIFRIDSIEKKISGKQKPEYLKNILRHIVEKELLEFFENKGFENVNYMNESEKEKKGK
ncbi:MAG: RAMP superfamily CRISPR-associated protein, partial [Promethearchaeota archaeon]